MKPTKFAMIRARTTWEVAFLFAWYDLWIGFFVDHHGRTTDEWYWVGGPPGPLLRRRLYRGSTTRVFFLPLPCLGLRLTIHWRDRELEGDALS